MAYRLTRTPLPRHIDTLNLTDDQRRKAVLACRATNDRRKADDPSWSAKPCVDENGHCCARCEAIGRA